MRTKHALVGIAIAALAGPALASGAQSTNSQAANGADAKKYCVKYESRTGSRLTRSECLTKAEWAKRGVDIDEMLRK